MRGGGITVGLVPQEMSPSVEMMQLEYIRPRHREIARRLILGQSQVEIARDLGMNQGRLSIIVNSPLFKLELKRLEDARDADAIDVTNSLKELAPAALDTVEKIMYQSKSEQVKLKAAESILDRAGYGISVKTQVSGSVIHAYHNYTKEELVELVKERYQRMEEEISHREKMLEEAKLLPAPGGNGE